MSELHKAAQYYASLGWKVFPLRSGTKIPATDHGVKDASTDEMQINAWWSKWPNANIGFACGGESKVHVIDVDVDTEKGIDGWKTINELIRQEKVFPKTVCQNTPRGGAHFFYQADERPLNRNSYMHGIDIRSEGYYVLLPPSIHPNGGTYTWAQGLSPWEYGLAEYPDFMRPSAKVSPALAIFPNSRLNVSPASSLPPTKSDVIERAKRYLATCEPAIQGLGGHDKIFWAAGALVHGFQLSDDESLKLLLQEYNPRCIPPWDMSDPADAKDFTRKVKEARKVPPRDKQPGWLLFDPAYAPDDVPDRYHAVIGKYIAQVKARLQNPAADDETVKAEESKNTERELRFLCQPTGLLGELCSWINSTTLQPQPFLTLACSLTFLGTLFGRKISDYMDSRTNLYCMGVIISSGGKNHAPKKIRQLCEKAGCEDLLGGDDIASDSAIERTLAEHPSTLYLWDEVGHMLHSMKHSSIGHKAGVVALLMKLYSSSGNNYRGKDYASQESRRIVQPCCCVYGTTSPHRFIEGITREEIEDGWLGRCLIFQAGEERPKKDRNRVKTPPPQSLIEKVVAWHGRSNLPELPTAGDLIQRIGTHEYERAAPKQIEIPSDDDAEEILRNFHDIESVQQGKENPEVDCLWAKAEENARKIALIVAASENYEAPRITRSVADYSVRLIRYLLNDFAREIVPQITSSYVEKEKLKIINVIKRSGKNGINKRELGRKTRWLELRKRNELLVDLLESGEIVTKEVIGKTRKTMRYWTPSNYNKYLDSQEQS